MSKPSPPDHDALVLDMRATARHLFDRALTMSSIDRAFERHVQCDRGVLRVRDDLYDLNVFGRTLVISMGKAAHSMLRAFEMQAGDRFEGIVAGCTDPGPQLRGFRYFRGGHPTPNQESWLAAESILRSLQSQNAASLVIYLISGGGSSIVEKPVDDEITLPDLIETYRVLVHSGAPISEVNCVRKHLSAVKGGRMAQAASQAQQVSILVSDVPDDSPDALASGPTMPDSTSTEDCYAIAAKYGMTEQFPGSVRELFTRHALDETPKSDDPAFLRSRWWTVLSNASLIEAAKAEAERHEFFVEVDNSCDDWDYDRAADYLLDRVRNLRREHGRVCLLSGGEVTVKVTGNGVGGRNQQFALACATKVGGEDITVLSGGTDGIDGNSPSAGAVVDGSTTKRADALGLDPAEHLAGFDAYSLFKKLGDSIEIGATGNNLRDLRILLAY
jgi:glycerate 2-kinase